MLRVFTEGDDSASEDEADKEDLDKEMGDLEGEDADRLDEQVWGSDDEEPQDQDKEVSSHY